MMKKYIFSHLLVFAAFVSCTQEAIPVSEQTSPDTAPAQGVVSMTFTALTDSAIEAPKTSLSGTAVLWSNSDHITVFAGENDASGATFDVSGTARGGLEATFTGSSETADAYYAVSPSQDASITDGVVTASLQTNQNAVAGSFGPTANLSVAVSDDNSTFQFRNVGAIVAITVGNDDVTGIKLETVSGASLSGSATINPATGELIGKSGEAYVNLSGSFAKNSTYYFVVLPGDYSAGFKLTFTRDGSYASFTTSGYDMVRNGNYHIGTWTASNWKNDFSLGEVLSIQNSGTDDNGQALVYVGAENYWNAINHAAVSDYAYNYEIFTRLNAGSKFYFKSAADAFFALNAAGTAVLPVAEGSLNDDRLYAGVGTTGIYRIRMSLPSGVAEIKQITAVKVYQNSCARENSSDGYMTLTYYQRGSWFVNNFCLRRGNDGWANRYKFRFTLKDLSTDAETVENYGRYSSSTSNPAAYPANYSGEEYFYVQPADNDNFEPGFKFVSTYEVAENRYYGRLGLDMNNNQGHYSHTLTWIFENRIAAGDEVYITGPGVNEDGNQVKMRYSASFNNDSIENYGDESGLEGADGYNYEVFCRLSANQKFFFNANGKHYELNSDASAVQPLYPGWGAISYAGISTGGVYRIRVNFETGTVSLDRVSEARYLQLDRGTNQQLSYDGNGVWKMDNVPFGWTHPNAWGNGERFKFWFQIYFMDKSTWQYLGRYDTDSYGVNIQTVTNASWSWNNKLSAENDDTLNTYLTGDFTATVRLKLNADGYTYEFTDITASN